MGKPTGFMDYARQVVGDVPPEQRLKNYNEFHTELSVAERISQGARCMDCGVPFCSSSFGCPLANLMPEWNDFIYQGRFEEAFRRLRETNNFPEFTGRVCPAICESACVAGIHEEPVTIRNNECFIADNAYAAGYMAVRRPVRRTGKRVAVIGSGPAGLAAAGRGARRGPLAGCSGMGALGGGMAAALRWAGSGLAIDAPYSRCSVSSLMRRTISSNISNPSNLYSTTGLCCPSARRPIPSRRCAISSM